LALKKNKKLMKPGEVKPGEREEIERERGG
jgi:hypothetical protein